MASVRDIRSHKKFYYKEEINPVVFAELVEALKVANDSYDLKLFQVDMNDTTLEIYKGKTDHPLSNEAINEVLRHLPQQNAVVEAFVNLNPISKNDYSVIYRLILRIKEELDINAVWLDTLNGAVINPTLQGHMLIDGISHVVVFSVEGNDDNGS